MKCIVLIVSLLISIDILGAQGVMFSSLNHDFGSIEEMGGDVECEFVFENRTNGPIVIQGVSSSCGCTVPEYTRAPIGVSESSSIKVTFDPRFRPGRLQKDIYVYISGESEPTVLTILGDVTPRELSIDERYPFNIGEGARIETLYVNMRNLRHDEPKGWDVEYINMTGFPLNVEFRAQGSDSALSLDSPQSVRAGESATLKVSYRADRSRSAGEIMRDTIDIFVNGERIDKTIFFTAIMAQ